MYIIYKRPTLDLKNTEAESVKSTQVKRQKRYSMEIGTKREQRWPY